MNQASLKPANLVAPPVYILTLILKKNWNFCLKKIANKSMYQILVKSQNPEFANKMFLKNSSHQNIGHSHIKKLFSGQK